MSHSLMLEQQRVFVSKKLCDVLCVTYWSDGVDLSRCGRSVITGFEGNRINQKETNRVSDDQDPVSQSLTLEGWQGFDGTNWPLGNPRADIDHLRQRMQKTEWKSVSLTKRSTEYQLGSMVNSNIRNRRRLKTYR